MEKKIVFSLKKLFNKDSDEVKKLKDIKKRIKKIKTFQDLEDLEEELIEIGLIDEAELEKIEKLKKKKRKKTEKELFEERVRCNLEIINRTILIGKQHKIEEKMRKDEEIIPSREERETRGNGRKKDRDEKIR